MSKEQEEELETSFKAARRFIKQLDTYLENKVNQKVSESEHELKYDNPNWMLYQADNRGYRRALRDVLKLIS